MPVMQEQKPPLTAVLDIGSLQQYWNDQVSGKPSIFARLVYLSRLWDSGARRYSEPTLEATLGAEGAKRVIRTTHELTFSHWLTFSLEQQKADVEIYLRGSGASPTLHLRPESYRALIPESALPHERELFLCDMAVIIDLIQAEPRSAGQMALRLAPVRA